MKGGLYYMNYVREFIELNQDQQGYNLNGKKIQGTCKFEVIQDKIKVKMDIKNLRRLNQGNFYTVHMIKVRDDASLSIELGDIEVDKYGRGFLNYHKRISDPNEIEVLKEFDVIAILLKDEKGLGNLTTPALGFRKSKMLWRQKFTLYRDYLEKQQSEHLKKFHMSMDNVEDKEEMEEQKKEMSSKEEESMLEDSNVKEEERISEDIKVSVEEGMLEDAKVNLKEGMLKESEVTVEEGLVEDTKINKEEEKTNLDTEVNLDEKYENREEDNDENIVIDKSKVFESNTRETQPDFMGPEVKDVASKVEVKIDETDAINKSKFNNKRDDTRISEEEISRLLRDENCEVVRDDDGNPIMIKRYIDIDDGCKGINRNKSSIQLDEDQHEANEEIKESLNESNVMQSHNSEKPNRLPSHELEEPCKEMKDEPVHLSRFSRRADEIFNTYPKLEPFQGAKKTENWIRIEPRDVAIFPINTWKMMNNPFLVRGYYKHRHLLLGENISESGKRYYLLAVPAQFNVRQKRIAKAHGFEYFRSCKNLEPKTGDFGYWVTEIHL